MQHGSVIRDYQYGVILFEQYSSEFVVDKDTKKRRYDYQIAVMKEHVM
jgi:hypothetical protein